MTYFEQIAKIIKENGGYITREDIDFAKIPSASLSQYVKKYELGKLCAGFYAEYNWAEDECLVFQYRYPKLIYSFYFAAYIHGLGDFIPPYLEVTGPKNYRPFVLPKDRVVLHTDTKESTYSLGITEVKTIFGNTVRVYDMEKTVCDFIKNRSRMDPESFIKCLRFYKKRKDKNISKLMKYARIMKIEAKVFDVMEIVLSED